MSEEFINLMLLWNGYSALQYFINVFIMNKTFVEVTSAIFRRYSMEYIEMRSCQAKKDIIILLLHVYILLHQI